MLWLDCCRRHWYLDSLCGILGGHCRSYGKRLEARLLHIESILDPGDMLHGSLPTECKQGKSWGRLLGVAHVDGRLVQWVWSLRGLGSAVRHH